MNLLSLWLDHDVFVSINLYHFFFLFVSLKLDVFNSMQPISSLLVLGFNQHLVILLTLDIFDLFVLDLEQIVIFFVAIIIAGGVLTAL
jgi:hypothetical protein